MRWKTLEGGHWRRASYSIIFLFYFAHVSLSLPTQKRLIPKRAVNTDEPRPNFLTCSMSLTPGPVLDIANDLSVLQVSVFYMLSLVANSQLSSTTKDGGDHFESTAGNCSSTGSVYKTVYLTRYLYVPEWSLMRRNNFMVETLRQHLYFVWINYF